ncbi:MAG: hypothetical protein K6G88_06285 [Lachnospiraceae bacterium]|nr:hypothetical protein [Lachnospiraceae bacterium]
MNSLNEVFVKAKERKVYKDLQEVKELLGGVLQIDQELKLDWDTGAGEEWARIINKNVGIICMLNTKIGIAFVRKKDCNNEVLKIISDLLLIDVKDYSTEEWNIDLDLLKCQTPEISWNVSLNAVDTEKLSLNDLYYATV